MEEEPDEGARIMEDEDLEETNNEDCGQRARRLAMLIKEEKTKGGQDRKQTLFNMCILRMIYSLCIYHVVPRPNSSSACARPSLRIRRILMTARPHALIVSVLGKQLINLKWP